MKKKKTIRICLLWIELEIHCLIVSRLWNSLLETTVWHWNVEETQRQLTSR